MTKIKAIQIVFVFSLFIFSVSKAQSKEDNCKSWGAQVDILENVNERLQLCKRMKNKVSVNCQIKVYNKMAELYNTKQLIDSSFFFYDKAIALAKELQEKELLATSYSKKASLHIEADEIEKGDVFLSKARQILKEYPDSKAWKIYYEGQKNRASQKSEFQTAIAYMDTVIQFSYRTKDTSDIAACYHNKAIFYRILSNYEAAVRNFLRSIELKEAQEHPTELARSYYSLSFCYYLMKQYPDAIQYLNKSIDGGVENDDEFLVLMSNILLSACSRKTLDFDEAKEASNKALIIARKLELDSQIASALSEQGWIYLEHHKDYDKAEAFFKEGYDLIKNSLDDLNIAVCLQGLADVNIKSRDDKDAKRYLALFKKLADKVNSPLFFQKMNESYSEFYEQTGNYKLAMHHYKEGITIKDSISSMKIKDKIAHIEKKYETKKKELEIVKLNGEKEEQKQLTQQAKSRQKLFLIAAVVLLFFLIIGAMAFRKLRKQQLELVAINQVKNRLFSIIAHDLRGMIVPFQRSGRILKHHIDKGNTDRIVQLSEEIEKNSDNLSNMLDNLLNWSLEQMNGYRSNPQMISVEDELEKILQGFEQQANFKQTKMSLKFEEDIRLSFDKGAFHVIFRNLIGNALKYTEDGMIRIEFKRAFNTFTCAVIDTGIGMSPEQIQSIFSLEENSSTIGTKGEKGTGIGLNLVNGFVKMHQGTIAASSTLRMGTRFDLSFPIVESAGSVLEDQSEPMSA